MAAREKWNLPVLITFSAAIIFNALALALRECEKKWEIVNEREWIVREANTKKNRAS